MKIKPRSSFPKKSLRFLIFALIPLFLVGCAGGSAKPTSHYRGTEKLPTPPAAYIYDFAVHAEDVVVDTFGPDFVHSDEASTGERLQEGRKVANALSEALVTNLAQSGITARRATATTHIPLNAIVVKGQFVSIKEGDETARVVVGFGAGAEKLEARVQVYQMREDGLRRISTGEGEAHGRKTPGVAGPAAVAVGAGMVAGVVVSTAMNLKSEAIDGSMQTNVNNLADEFVKIAVKFYKRHGWL
jgi:hypothetical protein